MSSMKSQNALICLQGSMCVSAVYLSLREFAFSSAAETLVPKLVAYPPVSTSSHFSV